MSVIDTDSNVLNHIQLLQQKNVTALGRYYSAASWKRITPREADAVAAAGIKLFTILENNGDPPLDGDAGIADAKLAMKQANLIGQPEGSAIYFALEHLPNGYKEIHIPGVRRYIKQVRSVFQGKYKVGAYSDGVILQALLADGLIDYAWLSASRGFEGSEAFYESGAWALAQDPHIDIPWDHLSIDLDEAKEDFGQFTLPSRNLVEVREQGTRSGQDHLLELANMELEHNFAAESQHAAVTALARKIQDSPEVLSFARNIATAIVAGPKNHCAATLSALLVFVGIFPVGRGTGSGDLEPSVVTLDMDLRSRKGWVKIPLGEQIYAGDVGVVLAGHGVHHIYLVLDASDQSVPIIADNQLDGSHPRPVAGDPSKNFSPTSYFLRAPS